MVFTHPAALWLLVLAIPLAALHVRGRTGLSGVQLASVVALRLIAFGCLVVAVAGPIVEREDDTLTTVAVVDVSQSMDDTNLARVQQALTARARQQSPEEDLRLVVFAEEAAERPLQAAIASAGGLTALRDAVGASRPGSSLATAIEFAGALIPDRAIGEVLLFSDGLGTDADASTVAFRLAERGIRVSVGVDSEKRTGEVVLRSVAMPSSGGIGATVALVADIESSMTVPATLIIRDDERGDEDRLPLRLATGRQSVTHPCSLDREGLQRYTVRLETAIDTRSDNNELTAAIWVEPPRRVYVVEPGDRSPAAAALAAHLGPAADVQAIAPEWLSAAQTLDEIDLLVLADVPAPAVSPDAQRAIKQAAVNGMGLLVTGGRQSFGPGGYARTPLADVLPVRMSQEVQRRDPSTTLVVIIDTSGSMGGARVNLAKEIARLAIARLKPHDKAGIVEFYGSKRWAAPIQPASNAIDLHRALNRLSAGGGTVILPAIEEAYYALQNVRTRTRHVLVLTDGGVETGAFEPLIRKMADKGITLSTVMVGPGGHSAFLAGLAQWGRGRFYAAPDRFSLPEIIIKQPESSMLTPFIEQPTPVRGHVGRPILDGVEFDTCPPVAGYVQTQGRPTADIVLESGLGHPILARWQYGLGMVAAYTTQINGEWTADFARWPPYARIMSGLVRSLCPPRPEEALRVRASHRPGAVELRIQNRFATPGESLAPLIVTLSAPAGTGDRRVIDPVAPGHWNARFTGLPPGAYQVDARTDRARFAGRAALVIPPVREVTSLAPDRDRLNEIQSFQARAAGRAGDRPKRPVEQWPVFAGTALLLLLVNVLLRRLPSRRRRRPARPVAWTAAIGVMLTAHSVSPGQHVEPGIEPSAEQAIGAALMAETWQEAAIHVTMACDLAQRRDGDLGALVDNLLARDQADPVVQRILAHVLAAGGQIGLASKSLERIRDVNAGDPTYWAETARLAEWSGDDDTGLAALDRAIELETDSARRFALQARRALLLYDAGDAMTASDALSNLAAEHTDDLQIQSFCALLAGLNDDNRTALSLLRPQGPVKSRFQDHMFRGLYNSRSGRFGEALPEFERGWSLAPRARDRRFALDRMVTAAREAGQLGVLADYWLQRLSDRGHASAASTEILQALVAVLREQGRPDDALALLQRDDLPDTQRQLIESPEFQREVIATAVEAGRLNLAESVYRSLVARAPDRAEWRVGLARLLLLGGRRDDAASLFDEGIDRFETERQLWGLAEGARRLGLHDEALRAARKIGRAPGTGVRPVLFEADLLRDRGDPDAAIALLKTLDRGTAVEPEALVAVADAFERYGDTNSALALLRRLHQQTKSEDVLLRVAWLLEQTGRQAEAYDLWLEMWRTTQVAARMRQAQERVLDLASRTGRLADLAIELEEGLDESSPDDLATSDDRGLSLLVDIYTLANDPVSAAEILMEYRRPGQPGASDAETVALLKQLVRIHLSCEQFGRCNRLLRQLSELDPDNADEYLQQIAVIALERRQPFQARAALAELAARRGPNGMGIDGMMDEFSAGVLARVGLHDEAAQAYGRVLARHPDRIEAFLSWGNVMRAAGRGEQAIGRFQRLLEEAGEDDLFAVAVDGLLNLGAPPIVLRCAYRRVMTRIASQPDKVFLYRLGADLLDAMGNPRQRDALLEQAVVVAGERRGPLLRELMDSAMADRQLDRMIPLGWSLLAVDEHLPPQVYLNLGEALIRTGRPGQADRVFARAGETADFASVRQQVATYYEDANRPDQAERILRELLAAEPDNVPLLIRSGGLCEQLASYDRAFAQYGRAADLMIRRLPRAVGREGPRDENPAPDVQPRLRRRATNLDEVTQYFDSAAGGLLNAARTPSMRERLLADAVARTREEMDALTAGNLWAAKLADNVRLARLSRFLRQVAFSVHRPDVADRIDRELAARYPVDSGLLSTLVRERIQWGRYANALTFVSAADRAGGDVPDVVPFIRIAAGDVDPADAFADGIVPSVVTRRYVPLLIMQGADEEARTILRTARPGPQSDAGETAPIMVAAAIALYDDEAVRRWATLWLERAARLDDPVAAADQCERCLRLTWNQLTSGERAMLCERVERLTADRDGDDRRPLDRLRMRLADAIGRTFDDRHRVLIHAADDNMVSAKTLASLMQHAEPSDRPGLVRRAVAARKPVRAREFLMALTGSLRGPADPRLIDTLEALFQAAPPGKFRADRLYSDVSVGAWNINPDQPELGRRIGEILLSDMPSEVAALTAVAIARANAGAYDDAMLLATEAVDLLLSATEPTFADARMWDDLARTMLPADRDELIADLEDRIDIEGATPFLLYARGVLLLHNRQRDEAVDAFAAAFRMSPTNRALSRRVIRLMQMDGRVHELARLLSAHLTTDTIEHSYEWRTLATLYRDLYDLASAAEAAARLAGPLSPIEQMAVLHSMGRVDDVRTTLLRYLITNRNQGRYYNSIWPAPPSVGGMQAHRAKAQANRADRPTVFTGVADLPFAAEHFEALLRAAPPDRRDVPGLVAGLLAATRGEPGRGRLIAQLHEACVRDAVTTNDRAVLFGLLRDSPDAIPIELVTELRWFPWVLDPANRADRKTLWDLATLHRLAGRPRQAGNILRWLTAYDLLAGSSATDVRQRFQRVREYETVAPGANPSDSGDRPDRRRIVRRMGLTPFGTISSDYAQALFQLLVESGDMDGLAAQVRELDTRLQADPSSRDASLYAAIAYGAAALDRFDDFSAAIELSCRDADRRDTWPPVPLDSQRILPPAGCMREPDRYVDVIAQALLTSTRGNLSPPAAARGLCLLGQWCLDHGLAARADRVLRAAQDLSDAPGEHTLWIADLARAAGHDIEADEMECDLLRRARLPVPRMPRLLDAIEARSGRATADALALRVAAYSDHPGILQRALRAANACDDTHAAAEYEKRLRTVHSPDLNRE